jgi:hypothetical protein
MSFAYSFGQTNQATFIEQVVAVIGFQTLDREGSV